jgi:hypothetical protein
MRRAGEICFEDGAGVSVTLMEERCGSPMLGERRS